MKLLRSLELTETTPLGWNQQTQYKPYSFSSSRSEVLFPVQTSAVRTAVANAIVRVKMTQLLADSHHSGICCALE